MDVMSNCFELIFYDQRKKVPSFLSRVNVKKINTRVLPYILSLSTNSFILNISWEYFYNLLVLKSFSSILCLVWKRKLVFVNLLIVVTHLLVKNDFLRYTLFSYFKLLRLLFFFHFESIFRKGRCENEI